MNIGSINLNLGPVGDYGSTFKRGVLYIAIGY